MKASKPIIGVIGAGRLGTAVARLSLKAGYEVFIANSRGPESLGLQLSILLPAAHASSVNEVIQKADVIVLAIPLHQYNTLPPDLFSGKIVIDAMNYWQPTEGEIAEFMDEKSTSSDYIQQYLSGARVVKTLNHIAYNELEEDGVPKGTSGRRAMVLAGNDTDAKQVVAEFIDDLGFDPVAVGPLSEGKRFQPDTPLFNTRYTEKDL